MPARMPRGEPHLSRSLPMKTFIPVLLLCKKFTLDGRANGLPLAHEAHRIPHVHQLCNLRREARSQHQIAGRTFLLNLPVYQRHLPCSEGRRGGSPGM